MFLALKDKNGFVSGSIPGMANMANCSVEKTEKIIAKFLAPDQYSRSKEYEGRRIEAVDGGWKVLNHLKYRDAIQHVRSNEKHAEIMRKKRAKAKADKCSEMTDDDKHALLQDFKRQLEAVPETHKLSKKTKALEKTIASLKQELNVED